MFTEGLILVFGIFMTAHSYVSYFNDERWFPPLSLTGMIFGSAIFWGGLDLYIKGVVEGMS